METKLKSLYLTVITVLIGVVLLTNTEINDTKNTTVLEGKICIPQGHIDTSHLETYRFIQPKIKAFNPQTNDGSIKYMAKVMHFYGLDETETMATMCVGQILQESGANQFYQKGHTLEGKLVVSSGGAIGIAQITSTTAKDYLARTMSKHDLIRLRELGCTDLSFINGSDVREKTKKWLRNEKNNMALWGYILSDTYHDIKDFNKTLISYNAGLGGLRIYLDSGKSVTRHDYIVGIKNKLLYISGV